MGYVMDTVKTDIELAAFANFNIKWESGGFPHLRYGQAFYNEFSLGKMQNQAILKNLYNTTDRDAAKSIIDSVFSFC